MDTRHVAAGWNSSQPIVLVVEDEPLISDLMSFALEEHGFATRCAANGREALEWLSGEERIDLLFTDINLPGDLDGAAIAERARAMRPGLPVVYASGRIGSLEADRRVPGSVFIPKPYNPDAVCTILSQVMKTRQRAMATA